MITSAECQSRIAQCQAIGTNPAISIQRATAVMAICHAFLALNRLVLRYETIVSDEEALKPE